MIVSLIKPDKRGRSVEDATLNSFKRAISNFAERSKVSIILLMIDVVPTYREYCFHCCCHVLTLQSS